MPRSLPLLLTCAFACLASACDRQSTPPAQPKETQAPGAAAEALNGEIDRSHAGAAMPAGTFKDASGKTLALTQLKGKPVLVNLWATWCAPCVVEMPLLDKLAGDLSGRLPVITVSEDFKAELVPPFFAAKGYKNLPQWVDPANAMPTAFNATALPLSVLYGQDGKEIWRIMGGFDWSSAAARKAVGEAIG